MSAFCRGKDIFFTRTTSQSPRLRENLVTAAIAEGTCEASFFCLQKMRTYGMVETGA